jgi:hypothetical protein
VDDCTGNVVLVTGAGQGRGRASAADFATRRASVVVNDIVADTGRDTVERIHRSGGTAIFVHADVSHEEQVASIVDTTVAEYGRLDVAVNNAEVEYPVLIATATRLRSPSSGANLEGVRACLEQEVRVIRGDGGGAIVNMSRSSWTSASQPFDWCFEAKAGRIDVQLRPGQNLDRLESPHTCLVRSSRLGISVLGSGCCGEPLCLGLRWRRPLCDAFHDDRRLPILQVQRCAPIAVEVPNVHGRRVAAEIAAVVEPDAVDWHHMWRAVAAHGGEPIMLRVNQPLLYRCPVDEPVGRPVGAGKL